MNNKRILVTGGSGFIAGHCILQLLEQGYQVRATLRSLSKEPAARKALQDAGMVNGDQLSFVTADLLNDAGWDAATTEIDAILHVASPVQPGHIENEDDLIIPAREGTLRVLRAAQAAGIRRVVLTSAFHAVSWGHPHRGQTFTENDWTNIDGPGVDAYGKSKTLAERAAWDYVADEGLGLELVTLLPVAVMGPLIGHAISGANHIVQRMLNGDMPGFPDLYIPVVDVRDVASAHILAMTTPAAANQRFLISNGAPLSMQAIGDIIKAECGAAAGKVPMRKLPSWFIRLAAPFKPELRHIVHDLGYIKQTSNEKARNVLGWAPRRAQIAVAAAASSMVAKGVLKG